MAKRGVRRNVSFQLGGHFIQLPNGRMAGSEPGEGKPQGSGRRPANNPDMTRSSRLLYFRCSVTGSVPGCEVSSMSVELSRRLAVARRYPPISDMTTSTYLDYASRLCSAEDDEVRPADLSLLVQAEASMGPSS